MSNQITIEVFTNTGINYSPVQVVQVDENEQPIFIQTSEYYAPVQSVNGKIGFVILTKEDLGISGEAAQLPNTIVYTTGDQTISGLKDFITRPTVNAIPVLLSGEAASSIEQYVKNDEGTIIYKGQPVYVNGSNGNNILIKLARNTGESSSSKTFGLLKQDLGVNQFGYVVTEGPIYQVNTSNANDGDPIWLGPTGNLIFGLTNKPKAPNHLVYLGFVERAHQNQGKIFVKPQNGFEIDELHNVRIINPQNNDIIQYNSGSGLWLNTNNNFATVINLELTGLNLNEKINTLSGNSVLKIQQNKKFVYSQTVTGNGNTTGVIAYGANCTITPKYIGTVRADAAISMTCVNATTTDVQQAATFWYGTGNAPVYSGNLVSLNGTRIGGLKSFHALNTSTAQNTVYPVSASWVAEITGLTTGTIYWFDIGISGSRMRVQDVQLYIEEKY